jgi:hypothetical protein
VRDLLEREPGSPQLRLERLEALRVDLLEREAEALGVAPVPVRRLQDAERQRHDLAEQLGDGVLAFRVLAEQLGQHLHAEADVALLVE